MKAGRIAAAGIVSLLLASGCSEGPTAPKDGVIRVTVQPTGGDQDNSFELIVGTQHLFVGANTSVGFTVNAGPQTVQVSDVADNCEVVGGPSQTVDVGGGQTVAVQFSVDCFATGVDIHVHTAGTDFPGSFNVRINQLTYFIGINDSIVVSRLAPGPYTVTLDPPENCAPVSRVLTVNVANRALTRVEFSTTCVPPVRLEKIAFYLDSALADRIGLVRPDGTDRVTIDKGQWPTWSPDGTKLAFVTTQCDFYYGYGCTGGLVVLDPETRLSSELVGGGQALQPAWAPAGNAIAFTRYLTPGFSLNVVDLTQLQSTKLATADMAYVAEPTWSPDGQRIAFTCSNSNNLDLCFINRDGTAFTHTVTPSSAERSPEWSPDGKTIAFASDSASLTYVTLLSVGDGGVRTLTVGNSPAWSPDGTRIVFARNDGLYIMNSDGSDIHRLIEGRYFHPVWRP